MQTPHLLNGRYRLADRLGNGGMSVVWKAHDDVLNRYVAVKVLAGEFAADAQARERVRAEAQAAAQLWHPNVTDVYDYGEAAGPDGQCLPYVVMELLPGRTLADRMREGPLPVVQALRICAEVAAALGAAHEQQLVHRDVKPSNVMLTPSGSKVVDFGLAAAIGEDDGTTDDGIMWGTPAYLAPERLTGDAVVPASDIYALGLLLYKALAGRLPWRSETTSQMLRAHMYVEPSPLPEVPGLPESVHDLCIRCLAKDPAGRPSAGEVERILSAAAEGVEAAPPQDAAAPMPAAGAAMLVAGNAGAAGGEAPGASGGEPTGGEVGELAGGEGDRDAEREGDSHGVTAGSADERSRDRRRRVLLLGLVVLPVILVTTAAMVWPGFIREPDRPPQAVPPSVAITDTPGSNRSASPGPGSAGGSAGQGGGSSGADSPGTARSASGAGPSAAGPSAGAGGAASNTGSGATAPAGGGAAPSPSRSAQPSSTSSGGLVQTVLGGTVTVRCVGDQAEVVDVDPATGFVVGDDSVYGPADQVRVVLVAGPVETVVTATCRNGTPVFL